MSEIEILLKWLEIKKKFSSSFPESLESLKINIHKSDLLKRMLNGQDPLPEPPPTYNSHPWYSLIEHGEVEISDEEFFFPEGWQNTFCEFVCVMIAQHPWEIIQEINPHQEYIITYHYMLDNQDTKSSDLWYFTKKQNIENSKQEIWKIKRIPSIRYI